MIDILVEGMTNNKGGKETYIINMFNFMDKTKYRFSFVAYDDEIAYEDYLKKTGAEVIHVTARHKGLFRHRKELCRLFETKHVDVVWAHKTTLSACEILSIAKSYHVPVRIVHSHSSQNMGGKFTYVMHELNQKFIFNWANEYIACSKSAANWFYGDCSALILKNGIDVEKFSFKPEMRKRVRERLGLQNCFVVGHVGRFGVEKNHKKLISVFAELKKMRANARLLLCGDGELRSEIEQQISFLGLGNDVILTGVIDNVNEMYQAMDVFVFPSFFEGFGIVILEAQAAGLRCVISNTVSREADVLHWNAYIPLSAENQVWAECILKMETSPKNRKNTSDKIKCAGFDIYDCVTEIDKIVTSKLR